MQQWQQEEDGLSASEPSSSSKRQQQQIQRLMRLAGGLYEQRGYAGCVEVEWMVGLYTQTSTLMFDRGSTELPPWERDEEVFVVEDLLEGDRSRLGACLRQLLTLLEERAQSWIEVEERKDEETDDLRGLKASSDPLLGATGTLGFSFFGMVGFQVSVRASVYASRLRRWTRRRDLSWPLAPDLFKWKALYVLYSQEGISGDALKKASANDDDLSRLLKGLDNESLTHCWHLADLEKKGRLELQEFVLFTHLAARAKAGDLPRYLPPSLVPPTARRRPGGQDTTHLQKKTVVIEESLFEV